jgi:hypothetical protein
MVAMTSPDVTAVSTYSSPTHTRTVPLALAVVARTHVAAACEPALSVTAMARTAVSLLIFVTRRHMRCSSEPVPKSAMTSASVCICTSESGP